MNPNGYGVSKASTPSGGISVVSDPIVRVIVIVSHYSSRAGGRWECFPEVEKKREARCAS